MRLPRISIGPGVKTPSLPNMRSTAYGHTYGLLAYFLTSNYARRMRSLDRRRFLAVAAATAISLKTFAEPASQTATLTLCPEKPGPTVRSIL